MTGDGLSTQHLLRLHNIDITAGNGEAVSVGWMTAWEIGLEIQLYGRRKFAKQMRELILATAFGKRGSGDENLDCC